MIIQLKFDLLCMLSGPEKKSGELFVFFHFFQQNSRWPTNHMLLWRAWTDSPICSKEATYPGHMLIRFWCDFEITFSRGLHKNLVTVYFSIINVLCGAGGDASFAPQANLVWLVLAVCILWPLAFVLLICPRVLMSITFVLSTLKTIWFSSHHCFILVVFS